jgi:hypothetical protein
MYDISFAWTGGKPQNIGDEIYCEKAVEDKLIATGEKPVQDDEGHLADTRNDDGVAEDEAVG